MRPEFIAILRIGATLAGTRLAAVLWLAGYVRSEVGSVRSETADLRERMARVEGLLEGLRDTIASQRDVA